MATKPISFIFILLVPEVPQGAAVYKPPNQKLRRFVNRRSLRRLRDRALLLLFEFGCYLGFGFWALELTAATTFLAASAKSPAIITAKPDWMISRLPASRFVPSSLTTSGTRKFTLLTALMIPCAITSHFMMPPKMLTRIAFTFWSE